MGGPHRGRQGRHGGSFDHELGAAAADVPQTSCRGCAAGDPVRSAGGAPRRGRRASLADRLAAQLVAGSAGLAGYPAMSPRSGMLKQKVDDHLFLNGDYELRPELHNGAPCWEKRPPDDEARAEGDNRRRALDEGDERRVLFRAADGRSWVIDTEAHDGNEDALVVARAWTGSADPTGIGRSWGPVPLCIHAAGVNCGSACLECAGAQEQGPSMANCC
ncbi:unnamed protein product [Prorocentrum cordatum]|uniref:Uncharacterized protein n=1 Tax=Prorocentrum cordatum TaxID=2364126 RepID=A0ABN9VWJ4_9DINO|nr:unnamed protein product [Polarella glacialis]